MSDKRPRQYDKFSSPDFERQQRQRTGDPTDNLPSRLRGRLSWEVTGEGERQQDHRPEDDRPRDRDRQPAQQQQQQDGPQRNNSGSGGGGRARIQFNLDRLQSPPVPDETKPRPSSKYSSRDSAGARPASPVLKRVSGSGSGADGRGGAAGRGGGGGGGGGVDRPGREQQRGAGSSSRQQSPGLSGPKGAERLRERERERERQQADRDRARDRERDTSQRHAAWSVDRGRDSSADLMRPRSRDEAADRSRERGRLGDREGSQERSGQGSRERGREAPAAREQAPRGSGSAGRGDAGGPASGRDSSRQREGDRERLAAREGGRDDGFARPQPRPPPAQQQQQQHEPPLRPAPPRPRPRPHIQWDEIHKADGMLAAVRARQAGLVQQQLSRFILTRALATDNVWDKACKAADMPSELLDGPLVAAARRCDCEAALMARASSVLMPPLNPSTAPALGAVGEDLYIQQLQALINRYEQQSAAPYCADVWALPGSGQAARRGAGQGQRQQQGVLDRASYSLLLPAELRGLLWDT